MKIKGGKYSVNVPYKVIRVLNDTALIQADDGKYALLDLNTKELVLNFDSYELLNQTADTFSFRKLIQKNEKESYTGVTIYDTKCHKLLAQNWALVIDENDFYIISSPQDEKLHLVSEKLKDWREVFNQSFDEVSQLDYKHWSFKNGSLYHLFSPYSKKTFEWNCENIQLVDNHYDGGSPFFVIRKSGKEKLRYEDSKYHFPQKKYDSIQFSPKTIFFQNGDEIEVYSPYLDDILFKRSCQDIHYLTEYLGCEYFTSKKKVLTEDGIEKELWDIFFCWPSSRKEDRFLESVSPYQFENVSYEGEQLISVVQQGKTGIFRPGYGAVEMLPFLCQFKQVGKSIFFLAIQNDNSDSVALYQMFNNKLYQRENDCRVTFNDYFMTIQKDEQSELIDLDTYNCVFYDAINPVIDDFYVVERHGKKGITRGLNLLSSVTYDDIKTKVVANGLWYALKDENNYHIHFQPFDIYEGIDAFSVCSTAHVKDVQFLDDIAYINCDDVSYVMNYNGKTCAKLPKDTPVHEIPSGTGNIAATKYQIGDKIYSQCDGVLFEVPQTVSRLLYVSTYEGENGIVVVNSFDPNEFVDECCALQFTPKDVFEKTLKKLNRK